MSVTHRVCLALAILAVPLGAAAQKPKVVQPLGVKPLTTIHPDQGFVDDAYAFDGSGGRVAFVRSDGGSFAEAEILDLGGTPTSVARFDLSRATATPVRVAFVADGTQLLVIGAGPTAGKVSAFAVGLDGKVIRRWGPAQDIALTEVGGAELVSVYNARPGAKGMTTHELAFFRVSDGRSVGRRNLVANADGYVKSVDLTILYWLDGYTRLVGRKKGAYDRLKDQRMNDSEARYDVIEGRLLQTTPPADVVEWTKIVKLRAERSNQTVFVHVTEDLKAVELVTAEDRRLPLDLAEPIWRYDPKSLRFELGRDGRIYFSLTIDPVNPEALERKVADPEAIDLYVVDAAGGKPVRLARVARADRPFSWRVGGGKWAVLRKHKGFERGGSDLEIFHLVSGK